MKYQVLISYHNFILNNIYNLYTYIYLLGKMSVVMELGLEGSLEDKIIYAIAKVLEEIVKETDIIESPI